MAKGQVRLLGRAADRRWALACHLVVLAAVTLAALVGCGRGPADVRGEAVDFDQSGIQEGVFLDDSRADDQAGSLDVGHWPDEAEPDRALDLPGGPDCVEPRDLVESSLELSLGEEVLDRGGHQDDLEVFESWALEVAPDPDALPDGPEDADHEDVLEGLDHADSTGPPDVPAQSDAAQDPGPPPLPFPCWSDSFEDAAWEPTGLWHRVHASQDIVNVWALPPFDFVVLAGPPTLTKPKDGQYAFWYGRDEDGSYLDVPDESQVAGGGTSVSPHGGFLQSPWIDLSGMDSATLTFWSWWEIESKHPVAYDLSSVEASADGETWVEVARLNPSSVPPAANPVLPYTVNGVGMPPSWHRTAVTLDAFAGGPVRIRFAFRTGDVFYNAFRGWVVDEVSILCVPKRGPRLRRGGQAKPPTKCRRFPRDRQSGPRAPDMLDKVPDA